MVYTNSSTLVINDYVQHCLETFDVITIQMKTYVGVCDTEGNTLTGHRISDVRLSRPVGLTFDGNETVYTSYNEQYQNRIIGINTTSDMVHELCGMSRVLVRSLEVDQNAQFLFVVLDHYIARADIAVGQLTFLSAFPGSGNSIGDLGTTKFTFPFTLLQVDTSTLLVSDRSNNRYV